MGGGHSADIDGNRVDPPSQHPWLRLTRRLEAGMVVTIEPGVYFIDSLLSPLRAGVAGKSINWARVDKLAAFGGIRIEDNICLTADGHRNLTREAFAAVAGGAEA